MTDAQWNACRLALVSSWPDAPPLDREVLNAWRGVLDPLPGELVLAAISSLMRDGREFRPAVGVIYRRAVDLGDDAPAWPEVIGKLREAAEWDGAGEYEFGNRWGHPLVRELIDLVGPDLDSKTGYARARDVYAELLEQRSRERRWAGIPGAAPRLLPRHDDMARERAARVAAELVLALDSGRRRVLAVSDKALVQLADDRTEDECWALVDDAARAHCGKAGIDPETLNDQERHVAGVLAATGRPVDLAALRRRLPGWAHEKRAAAVLKALCQSGVAEREGEQWRLADARRRTVAAEPTGDPV